jgi:hypothetical protein
VSIVIERNFFLANHGGPKGGCRRTLKKGVELPPDLVRPAGWVPRISKLMALAIRCDQLLQSRTVPDATALLASPRSASRG